MPPAPCSVWDRGGAAATFPTKTQRLKVPNQPLLTLSGWRLQQPNVFFWGFPGPQGLKTGHVCMCTHLL